MSNFFIVPTRLVSGSVNSSGVVTSLNGLASDITFTASNGMQAVINGQSINLSLVSGTFVLKSGDIITGNLQFQPNNNGYGLKLFSSAIDPIITNNDVGAIYYNTSGQQGLRVYSSAGWVNVGGALNQSTADTLYLKLDATNSPLVGDLKLGTSKITLGNKASDPVNGNPGDIFYNSSTNTARLYVGGSVNSWISIGSGISQISTGSGLTGGNITSSGVISLDLAYSPFWTGNHTFSKPIVFASNQAFSIGSLSTTGQTNGDIIYYNNGWTRLPIGSSTQVLSVSNNTVSWQNAGSTLAIGNPVTGGTANSVLFVDTNGKLSQNANLSWDGLNLNVNNLVIKSVSAPVAPISGQVWSDGTDLYYQKTPTNAYNITNAAGNGIKDSYFPLILGAYPIAHSEDPIPIPLPYLGNTSSTWTFRRLDFRAEVAPTGGNATVNVRLNGVLILSQYLSITAGNNFASTSLFSVTTGVSGDLLTVSFGDVNNSDRWGVFVSLDAPSSGSGSGTGSTGAVTSGVSTINGLKNDVSISSGGGISINTSGQSVVISSAGNVSGTGTVNTIPVWSSGTTLQNSIISQPDNNTVFVNGKFTSVTKSFTIPHPTLPNKNLVYGSLEGPEHGVYHRGHAKGDKEVTIILPEYWSALVGDNYIVTITSCNKQNLYLKRNDEKSFTVDRIGFFLFRNKPIEFNYVVIGSRTEAPLNIIQDI